MTDRHPSFARIVSACPGQSGKPAALKAPGFGLFLLRAVISSTIRGLRQLVRHGHWPQKLAKAASFIQAPATAFIQPFAFLPDMARAFSVLAEMREALPHYARHPPSRATALRPDSSCTTRELRWQRAVRF